MGHQGGHGRAFGAPGAERQLLPVAVGAAQEGREGTGGGRAAYVHGISTRKVDELVKALAMNGIGKSRISKLREELDEEVERFRNRPLKVSYPHA